MYHSLVLSMVILFLGLDLTAPAAMAAEEASVTITSPADGAKLDAKVQNKLVYDVKPGPLGDHVHVYVDGKQAGILRQLKSSHTLPTLTPGSRNICVKVVTKAHVPIGVERCVKVAVE